MTSQTNEFTQSLAAVGDAATCTGFRLAGVQQTFALQGKPAEKKLEELLEDTGTGIIVVTETLLAGCDWRLKKKIERIAKPVVIAVPDLSGPSSDVESLRSLVKRALGFELMK